MLEHAVRTLSEHIEFDALVAGAGSRLADGSVQILQVLGCHGVARAFIDDYPAIAHEDVVGQLFAAYPRIVQVISVEDYRTLGKLGRRSGCIPAEESIPGARARKIIADYLERSGIQHLMLAGLDSSFGLAWITFYRKSHNHPFDAVDAEWARYLVPSTLYQWQNRCEPAMPRRFELPTRLLPLTGREMQIAVLDLEGMRSKAIACRLKLSDSYVKTVIKNIRTRLGISGRRMIADDLEKYGGATHDRYRRRDRPAHSSTP